MWACYLQGQHGPIIKRPSQQQTQQQKQTKHNNNSQSSTSDYHSDDNPANLLPVTEHRELPNFRLHQLNR